MVHIDCGRRWKAYQLKRAEPLTVHYSLGDLVMYRKDEAVGAPGEEWSGPARLVGIDGKSAQLAHGTLPVVSALHKLRPASASEMMAYQVAHRLMRPVLPEVQVAQNQQISALDARTQIPRRYRPIIRTRLGEDDENMSKRTRASAQPAEASSSSTSMPPRIAGEDTSIMPPRIAGESIIVPAMTDPVTRPSPTPAPVITVEYDDRSQLERQLDATASVQPSDPGRRLAEALRQRNVERSRSPKGGLLSVEVLDE